MIGNLVYALTGVPLRQVVPACVEEERAKRRRARENIRQISRTRTAELIGFYFYQTTKTGGWAMPRRVAREIGLPTEANYLIGLADAFVRFGMRRTVELARAAGIRPTTVAKWAVAASRYIRRESRHNAWSIQP